MIINYDVAVAHTLAHEYNFVHSNCMGARNNTVSCLSVFFTYLRASQCEVRFAKGL